MPQDRILPTPCICKCALDSPWIRWVLNQLAVDFTHRGKFGYRQEASSQRCDSTSWDLPTWKQGFSSPRESQSWHTGEDDLDLLLFLPPLPNAWDESVLGRNTTSWALSPVKEWHIYKPEVVTAKLWLWPCGFQTCEVGTVRCLSHLLHVPC